MSKWITGDVVSITHWTDSLFTLKLKAAITPFIAGQFTQLSLEINGQHVQRAYSYVNSPDSDELEFYIVTVENGKLSPYLQQLKCGDTLKIANSSTGFFVLNEIPSCHTLWMIATGTGIAPYLSILRQQTGLDRFNHLVLVHATRYTQDLSYLPLMNKLQEQYQGKLHIKTIVSRESVPTSLSGRIPQLIDNGQLEQSVGLTITVNSSHIMLCGNPVMVTDTINVLKQRGISKHLRRKPGHITSERYW